MPVGYLSTVGSTADFTLTRDQLIEAAFQTARLMPEGEALTPEQLAIGIVRLGMIVREVDASGKWVWTTQTAFHLPLQAHVGVYDANSALPTNISEVMTVAYRSADGCDSPPLTILSADGYEEIGNKLKTGEPCAVYLTNEIVLAERKLYVWPFLSSVTTQSRVIGTDTNIYRCTYPHTSASTTQPTTGANWRMVWELGAGLATTWAPSVAYTSVEAMRISYKRPIYDFDDAAQTPDFPMQWPRLLMLRLASDLGDVYGIPQADKDVLAAKIRGSFADIFPSTRPRTTNIHHKTHYF